MIMLASPSYARTYKCWRYVKGKPSGTWVKVKADSKTEAEGNAYAKFKALGKKVDSVNCR